MTLSNRIHKTWAHGRLSSHGGLSYSTAGAILREVVVWEVIPWDTVIWEAPQREPGQWVGGRAMDRHSLPKLFLPCVLRR